MQTLTKGANAPLTADDVTVQVACSSPVDVSALLLTEQGRVRSDDDMVFYNQPNGPGVPHRAGCRRGADTVALDPRGCRAGVERVVVTASLDGRGPATFGAVGVAWRAVLDAAARRRVEFPVSGLASERALVCVEVYRRAGAWKVRAVGQGYDDGLAGIATDFGITVDDAPAAGRGRPPPPPPAPAAGARRRLPAPAGRALGPRQPRQGPGVAAQAADRLAREDRRPAAARRCAWAWAGTRPGAAPTSTSTPRSSPSTSAGKDVEKVWFGNLTGFGGADPPLRRQPHRGGRGRRRGHHASSSTGCPAEVEGLVFTVNSFRGPALHRAQDRVLPAARRPRRRSSSATTSATPSRGPACSWPSSCASRTAPGR